MWFIYALITFLAWGTADLFYKKSGEADDRYAHLKTSIIVGLVMGGTAVATILIKGIDYDPVNLLIYLPVSSMYILSMTVGYFGLRWLELSISSPIQNSSGAVSCLLLIVVLGELPDPLSAAAIVLITVGVVLLGVIEKRREKDFCFGSDALSAAEVKKYRMSFIAFLMPVLYCFIDALGTFLDGYYLDDITATPLRGVTEETFEDVANISYELTFLIAAVLLFIYVRVIKKEKMPVRRQGWRGLAAVCETAGQFTYVYAMSGNGIVAAPMIASYCVASVVLARIFLKEKLTRTQYLMIALVFIGILLLGLSEGLNGG